MKGIDQYTYYQNILARISGKSHFSHTTNGVDQDALAPAQEPLPSTTTTPSTANANANADVNANANANASTNLNVPAQDLRNSREPSDHITSPTDSNSNSSRDASNDTRTGEKSDTPARPVLPPPRGVEGTDYVIDARGNWILTEAGCYEELGFSWSSGKKWTILWIVFLVQVSMNFNTSLYSNAISGMQDEFGISAQAGRVGAMLFLICYAFGCEIWAPWSEDFGRWPIMQFSLLFVNIWQLPVALAQNYGTVIIGRILGGFSSAGGSVTLAMVADLFEPEHQQMAVAFIVFSSVGGSILGPVIGGFSESFLHWRWSIWLQLIFGGFVQLLHLFFVPETRSVVLVNRIAKRRRLQGERGLYGPTELVSNLERWTWREIGLTWIRPFQMFVQEPIVLTLSLLSGFSDALIFMFIQSFGLVYARYHFSTVSLGLAFIPILIGYFACWTLWVFIAIPQNRKLRARHPESEYAQYENRLLPLLWTAPFLPIGLMIFAWTSTGPPIPWIASMIGAALVGVANYAIYMGTIDYMITAYGPYSASATGGNGWARDFLAGCLTMAAVPMYENIGSAPYNLAWPSLILSLVAGLLVVAVFVVYNKGETLRKKSHFAQQLGSGEDPFNRSARPIGRSTTNRGPAAGGNVAAQGVASGHDIEMHDREQGHAQMQAPMGTTGTTTTANASDPLPTHGASTPPLPSGAITPRRGNHKNTLARERQDLSVRAATGSRSYTPRSSAPGTREHSPVRGGAPGHEVGGGGDGGGGGLDMTREESMAHAEELERGLTRASNRG